MLNIDNKNWTEGGRTDLLKAGDSINQPELLFEKIDDETIQLQIDKLTRMKEAAILAQQPSKPAKEDISYDDFQKMDLRIVTILEAEKIAKTKKLLKKLTVILKN